MGRYEGRCNTVLCQQKYTLCIILSLPLNPASHFPPRPPTCQTLQLLLCFQEYDAFETLIQTLEEGVVWKKVGEEGVV